MVQIRQRHGGGPGVREKGNANPVGASPRQLGRLSDPEVDPLWGTTTLVWTESRAVQEVAPASPGSARWSRWAMAPAAIGVVKP
jgi:hypothetical protein